MANAVATEATTAKPTATLPSSRDGSRIRKTPPTAANTDNHTDRAGLMPLSGHCSSATQIGKVLVMASTLDNGTFRVIAKNVHTRLTLPATLRIHSDRGRKNTSCAPPPKANAAANT